MPTIINFQRVEASLKKLEEMFQEIISKLEDVKEEEPEELTGRILDASTLKAWDTYYIACIEGYISEQAWNDSPEDELSWLDMGALFYDKASAEKEALRLKTVQKLRVAAGGFKPDSPYSNWWGIDFHHNFIVFECFTGTSACIGEVKFETELQAQSALDSLTEEERNSLLEG